MRIKSAKSKAVITRKPAKSPTSRRKSAKPDHQRAKSPKKAPNPSTPAAKHATVAHPDSKQASLIDLLKTQPGATLSQMTTLTGWQPHTVRGVISGVFKKKLSFKILSAKASEGGERVYRIVGNARP